MIGTWATAPQFSGTASVETFRNQSLRLIVHTGAGGRRARIKISNIFGDQPLEIGGAHIARRITEAEIEPASDRKLMFGGQDGSTRDANRRWPDVLAERLQKDGGRSMELGVLNSGIIGNRLLADIRSPRQAGGPFGEVLDRLGARLGDAGVARFDRDVLAQAGVKYVILALGINDILFPGSFIPASESVSAHSVIAGHRLLIARGHKKGIRVIVTTIPPFEDALFRRPAISFSTPEKEQVRRKVNAWIRSSGEFDGVIDFDEVVRDPSHPARLTPGYDTGDHLHVNDVGNVAQGNAIPLTLFRDRTSR